MKRYIVLCGLLLFAISALSQSSLAYKNNALRPGDVNTSSEIQYVAPGNPGPNQIWDFSGIKYTGTKNLSRVLSANTTALVGVSEYNVLLNEGGYEYYFNISSDKFEEKGYTLKDLTVIYADPLLKMKYPFAYGESFTDNWTATALFKSVTKIEISGDFTVTADATGDLILPDRTLSKALRIKTEKNSVEMNPCNSTVTHILRYLWYAPGYRYPVLVTTVSEYKTTGQEPRTTKIAAVNLQQEVVSDAVTVIPDSQPSFSTDILVNVFPNPFSEKLSYNYFLRKQMPVTITLYDITGKSMSLVMKTQTLPEGVHQGEINPDDYSLTPGIYYLRFTFENKVIVKKIVKM